MLNLKVINKINSIIDLNYEKPILLHNEYFMINKANTKKKLWKGIKQLLCLKSKGSTLPSKLIINEQEITGTFDKATADQLLNKFFSESRITNNVALAVPKPNLLFNCYNYKQSPANSAETENIIMSLSSAKACSTFSISTSLFKTLKGILSIALPLLFYCSFSTGLVPDQ